MGNYNSWNEKLGFLAWTGLYIPVRKCENGDNQFFRGVGESVHYHSLPECLDFLARQAHEDTIRHELQQDSKSMLSALLILEGRRGYMLEKYGNDSEKIIIDVAAIYSLKKLHSMLKTALDLQLTGHNFIAYLRDIQTYLVVEVERLKQEDNLNADTKLMYHKGLLDNLTILLPEKPESVTQPDVDTIIAEVIEPAQVREPIPTYRISYDDGQTIEVQRKVWPLRYGHAKANGREFTICRVHPAK